MPLSKTRDMLDRLATFVPIASNGTPGIARLTVAFVNCYVIDLVDGGVGTRRHGDTP